MIDEFDYKEPCCPLTGGKEFYYPTADAPLGRIPVDRIIDKVDGLFHRNDYVEAGRLLVYWKNEAVALKDKRGELAVQNELVGYYRKQGDHENGLVSIARALELVDELEQGEGASGATILINCATAYCEFGEYEKSMPLYHRAEEVYRRVFSAGDQHFGALYNNMALTLSALGDFDEAEASFQAALGVMEHIPGGEAEAAITYVNLAHLYDNFDHPEHIRACMEKAYALLQSETLPHNGYYAFVLEKCAPSFAYFGEGEISAQMEKESREIYERA